MKITLTHGEEKIEKEGAAVVAAIINPTVEGKPDAAGLLFGTGSAEELLLKTATSIGTLVKNMIPDPLERVVISALMVKKFQMATLGIGVTTDVEENRRVEVNADDDEQGSV